MHSESDFELDELISNLFSDESLSILQDIQSWKGIPMVQWSPADVLEFIKSEISEACYTTTNLERFQCISGNIFKNLSKEYCVTLAESDTLGTNIFEVKENYIRLNPFTGEDYHAVNKENSQKLNVCDIFIDETPRKRLGRPRTDSKKRRKEKSEKLWEFLLHLLQDEKTCPALIKWENRNEGTFKFVNNKDVAKLWGSRNQNKTMNFEKFSRAIRYHYKKKVLLPVPGQRLVYKFGPHAKGWRSSLSAY